MEIGVGVAMRLLLLPELQPLRDFVVLIDLVGHLLGETTESRDKLEVARILDRKTGNRRPDSLRTQREKVPELVPLEWTAHAEIGIPIFGDAAALADAQTTQFIGDV